MAVVLLMASEPSMIKRLDRIVYDTYLKGMTGGEPSPVPVLVDIDERSLGELGQWPWPRYRLAELMEALNDYGVASVGVDILMPEPDRTSPTLWARQLSEDFGIEPDITGLPPELMDNDRYLASIVRQLPIVLSAFGTPTSSDAPESAYRFVKITPFIDPGGAPFSSLRKFVPDFSGIQMPVACLAEAASYIGLMNAEGDEDSIFRRIPLINSYNGSPVTGLALAALALGAGDSSIVVRMAKDGPRSIRVAGIEVPVSRGGSLSVAFRGGSGVYPVFSAADVLRREVPAESLAGRIVFLGSTAVGLLDLRPTPFDGDYPGLEMHAAAVDTILSKRFIIEPESRIGLEFIMMLATGTIAAVLFGMFRPYIAFPIGAAMAAAIWLGFRREMVTNGIYLTPLYSLINMVIQAFSSFALRFWLEEKEKRMLRKAFSNYVSPEIVGRIVERGSAGSLQGEQRDISVLFTDIRGFTSMTENMAPTQVVGMLGSYFAPMTAIVRGSMGTLDKFVGDALMAFWNAPLDVPDHPSKAVLSLLEMHKALDELNKTVMPEFGVRLSMGGGIHTGLAHVGNMGTSELMDYTAIGDTVNTASRLEGMCSKYGVNAVISKDTADRCEGRFATRPIDFVRVKGRSAGIPIFSVLSFDEAEGRKNELDLWKEAFSLYISGDFRTCGKICRSLLEEHPLEKLYKVFEERTISMLKSTPENWDGVFSYENK
jgi:adenylate cyclase